LAEETGIGSRRRLEGNGEDGGGTGTDANLRSYRNVGNLLNWQRLRETKFRLPEPEAGRPIAGLSFVHA